MAPDIGGVRPAVRVNQLGYLPTGPKRATWVTSQVPAAEFVLVAAGGDEVWRGRSQPWPVRPEPTSGQAVHVLDFTAVTAPGRYRLVAGPDRSHEFRIAADLYDPLAADALGLFRRLRCVHPDTAVPAWTGPDAARLYPGWRQPGTFDVSGGWYDAGDYGKYTTSGSLALWQLLHVLDLRPGDPAVTAECRWQLDWLLRMQVPAGQPLAGMAFHRVHGTEWSPIRGAPGDDPTTRVLHRPSTTATLHLAAVAVLAARQLPGADVEHLLAVARTAWAAARQHPDLLAPDDEGRFGGGPYHDPDPADDVYWAAAELWLATGEDTYRREMLRSPLHTADVFDPAGFDMDRVAAPARIDLASGSVVAAADRLLALQAGQPWGQPYAPAGGWVWGSNGRILNNLVVLAAAHRLTGDGRYRDAVATGVDYLLGRNALGQSYVTGYGTDATHRLRTRQFADGPLPPGAVAGGANSVPTPGFPGDPRLAGRPPQLCYLDEPTSEVTNDICIRWNAPLAYVAAFLSGG